MSYRLTYRRRAALWLIERLHRLAFWLDVKTAAHGVTPLADPPLTDEEADAFVKVISGEWRT
jgi:hypothetical protein